MDDILSWKKKRAAIYTRVSTMEQAEKGTSMDYQLDICRKTCDIKNYQIIDEYPEGGVSGTVPATKRKQFSRFFENAKGKRYDVLVIYCFDRLAREIRVFLSIID